MTHCKVYLAAEERGDIGWRTVLGTHGLSGEDLFGDAALIDLLDHFPREHLYALNMGHDPCRSDQNHLVCHDGVSGAELLQAVRSGRLWLNVTRVDRADARYRRLIDRLYNELRLQTPLQRAAAVPDRSQGTLLISSPGALVYFHADAPSSVLWHLRGRKRVWIYPTLDERFMSAALLEDLFAGARHEYLPYRPDFDLSADVYDLEPGQWLCWPQNAPHRVQNLDGLNVSLSTEHFSRDSCRRAQLYRANRYLRRHWRLAQPSACETGVTARAKVWVQRVARRLGLDPVPRTVDQPVLRISPASPDGVVVLERAGP